VLVIEGVSKKHSKFLTSDKDPLFNRGDAQMARNKLRELEGCFKRWKSKPWGRVREVQLGKLAIAIRAQKELIEKKKKRV